MVRFVRVTMKGEINSVPEHQNCVIETQLPEALETNFGVAEVVKMARLLGVTLRDEVNSIPVPRNCILEALSSPRRSKRAKELPRVQR